MVSASPTASSATERRMPELHLLPSSSSARHPRQSMAWLTAKLLPGGARRSRPPHQGDPSVRGSCYHRRWTTKRLVRGLSGHLHERTSYETSSSWRCA